MNETLKIISPVDGQLYAERFPAKQTDIEQALQRARKAQAEWQNISIAERAVYCTQAMAALAQQKTAIAEELAWQMGRPIRFSGGEISGVMERADYMIKIAVQALADRDVGEKEGYLRFIKRQPLGVVLTISPWNFPYLTAVNTIIPALMAGNAVILKHAQQTLLCAERFQSAFAAASLPEGLFQVLHLTHRQTSEVIRSGHVNYVAFTGSVPAGAAIETAAAGMFVGVGLELGGKDPAYVRSDCDLEHTVESLVDGAFFNTGQSCCGIERIYVQDTIYQDFLERFVGLTRNYVLGNPLDPDTTLGPLVKTAAADFVRDQIAEAQQAGALALIRESDFPASRQGTPYLAPQVLINVDHSMRVMTEESFGPVVGIMKVNSDEEAIRLMNDSAFGLTASLWTRDQVAATAIGNRVETGTLFLNRCDYLDPALAWTGVKQTGRGCTLSTYGYDALTRPKSYHFRLSF